MARSRRKGPISKIHEEILLREIGVKVPKKSKLQKKKDDPFSKYWRTKADQLFRDIYRKDCCELCGSSSEIQNVHHILRKEDYHKFHYEALNLITLCAFSCHKRVAHYKSVFFLFWLKKYKTEQCVWVIKNCENFDTEPINFKYEYERLLTVQGSV